MDKKRLCQLVIAMLLGVLVTSCGSQKPATPLADPADGLVRVNTLIPFGAQPKSETNEVDQCFTGNYLVTNQGTLMGQITLLDGTTVVGMTAIGHSYTTADGFQFIELSDGNIGVYSTGNVCQAPPPSLSLDEIFQAALDAAKAKDALATPSPTAGP